MAEIHDFIFSEKQILICFYVMVGIILLCIISELYIKIGLCKTLLIIGVSVIILLFKNVLIQKFPYDFPNDFYYSEKYYYNNLDTKTARSRYEIKYNFGKLTYICDVLDTKYRETKSVTLNWKERKEFKTILKQYRILEWDDLEEYLTIDSNIKLNGIKTDKFYSCRGNLRTKNFYFEKDTIPINYIEFRKQIWTFVLKAVGEPEFSEEEDSYFARCIKNKKINNGLAFNSFYHGD